MGSAAQPAINPLTGSTLHPWRSLSSALTTVAYISGRQYSQNYYKILEKRVTLPVYEFKDKFTKTVQVDVLISACTRVPACAVLTSPHPLFPASRTTRLWFSSARQAVARPRRSRRFSLFLRCEIKCFPCTHCTAHGAAVHLIPRFVLVLTCVSDAICTSSWSMLDTASGGRMAR